MHAWSKEEQMEFQCLVKFVIMSTADGVVATGSSPLVLQGADGLLTVDCFGLLKADTWRAHTSGGT